MARKDEPTVPIHALDKNVTKPVRPADPLIGHRIADRYELLQPLAEGGFGRVYKARDTKLERIVAIKLVDLGKASEDTRARMLREARANARLHHPNVVVLHDAGEDPYGLYLVLEYVAGTSLADALSDGPLEAHRAAEITRECATALAAAHAHGIVHRDIKPGNILLTESGRVKVADFGVARMVGQARLTDRGSIIGTPNYMAPEQIEGSEVGAEADMFALGCVLYEMLAGRPPFDGKTTSEVLGRILRGTPNPLPPLDHTVAPLVDAMTSLLDKIPQRRLRPNELIQRLRSWERKEGPRPIRIGRRQKVLIISLVAVVAGLVGASLALRDREPGPVITSHPPALLVRVTDAPVTDNVVIEETITLSSRDALFAYLDFVGRDRSEFRKVDDRSILVTGTTESVRMRVEEAKVIDQLLGYEFFREPSLLTSDRPSNRLVSCDFDAIQPSELIGLFSAAAGWPVVQSADVPLEHSAFLRVSAENQSWDEIVRNVLRAAGLATHRYETIWLVTSEDIPVIPRSKVLAIFPRRHSTEDVRQRAADAMTNRGVAWRLDAGGREAVAVVDEAGGIDAVLESIDDLRGPDWEIVNPRRFTGQPVSLRLDGSPIGDMLAFYGSLTRRPHVAEGDLDGWVRANIVEIPSDEYLAAVLDANRLTTHDGEDHVLVRPFEDETIEVRLRVLDGASLAPLVAHASSAEGSSALISIEGLVVRIEGRNDIARELATVVKALDDAMAR